MSRGAPTRVTPRLFLFCSLALAACGAGAQGPGSVPDAGTTPVTATWSTRAEIPGADFDAVWGQGPDVFAAGKGGAIARTSDAGQTWMATRTGVDDSAGTTRLRHIAGTGADDLWIAGEQGPSLPLLLHSGDRGHSWERRA